MSGVEDLPKFLTCEDLQTAFGGPEVISARTLQRMARRGQIPGLKRFGRKYFFQREPVLKWIEGADIATLLAFPARRAS